MCRTFEGYSSISYTGDRAKGVNKLKKKMKNRERIVQITTNTSYVYKYKKMFTNIFLSKVFIYFSSGFFSSLVTDFVEFYLKKIKLTRGIEVKVDG